MLPVLPATWLLLIQLSLAHSSHVPSHPLSFPPSLPVINLDLPTPPSLPYLFSPVSPSRSLPPSANHASLSFSPPASQQCCQNISVSPGDPIVWDSFHMTLAESTEDKHLDLMRSIQVKGDCGQGNWSFAWSERTFTCPKHQPTQIGDFKGD